MLGYQTVQHKERQVFNALQNGFTNDCYDGQFFFDTDHPGKDENGNDVLVSNMQAGAGPAWYLMSTKMPLKPIIFQKRRGWDQVALDRPDDPDVFSRKQLKYGVDSRSAVGYGYWQMSEPKPAAKPAPEEGQGATIFVRTKRGIKTRWRIGRNFGPEPREIPLDDLNEDQLGALENDPSLVVSLEG